MNYKKYKISRNLAWEVLIHENIIELPVDIVGVCRNMGIDVRYGTNFANGNDGYSTIIEGVPYITISPEPTKQRKRFTVAHELGHILLGHVGKYRLINREPTPNDNPIEQAANVFAARLLAPACVLWGCNVHTTEDIMKLCDISRTAAEIRSQRMEILYERDKFLTSPMERQVYDQFREFINHQQEKGF